MALVIGNGESRANVNINNITQTKFGCNAILRDFWVNHLICVDRKMVREAVNSDYNGIIYTRKDWYNEFQDNKNVHIVPQLPYEGTERADDPFHWGSGPYAVLLASLLTNEWEEDINLIGFDLYSKNDRVNNIYKDSPNYNNSDHHAIDPRYWIHQIGIIFKNFTHQTYKIYSDDELSLPKALNNTNVSLDKLSNL